jgi:AcrR family transcriptional regulator
MPKLWQDSVDAHRAAVREATLDAVDALIGQHGLPAVTMSRIAQSAGIGRATLYKYFPDIDAVLSAWHQRQVHAHLAALGDAAERPGTALERLTDVLFGFAHSTRKTHGSEYGALLHHDELVLQAQEHLRQMLAALIADAAAAGDVRGDVPPAELAAFCLHALSAARSIADDGALQRLVELTLAGLRPLSATHSTSARTDPSERDSDRGAAGRTCRREHEDHGHGRHGH